MAEILASAGVFWVTEALPLAATSLLANPGGWSALGFVEGPGPSYHEVLGAAVDSTLVLFFSGLVLAQAAVKERVDQTIAAWLLLRQPPQRDPPHVLAPGSAPDQAPGCGSSLFLASQSYFG